MTSEPYLDYAATTPLDPRVQAVMNACALSLEGAGNPSSAHALGTAAASQVDAAAEAIGQLINADPAGLIWTSGATEANNLAILGSALALLSRAPDRRRILVLATDHSAAIEPALAAEKWGFSAVILPVAPSGELLPSVLKDALDEDVALVSLALVNNETGVIQDLKTLAPMVRAVGARLHVDATQAVGRIPVDVSADEIDFLSFSGHKFYGPKGIGGLYARPSLALEPLLHGGGQQAGRRPGTLPVPLIKGMAAAFSFADDQAERDRQNALRARLMEGLSTLGQVVINGQGMLAPHILSLSFPGVHGAALAHALDGLAVSHGSACGSQQGPSHVLRAMGRPNALAHATVRMSIGRFSTNAEVDMAVQRIGDAVATLRGISPIWRELEAGEGIHKVYGMTTPLEVA